MKTLEQYTKKEIEAMEKALAYIGLENDTESLINHIDTGCVSINVGRNCNAYAWAIWSNEGYGVAVNVRTGKIITDERFIKSQFC